MYLMGVQCHSGTVQPVFRSPLFQNGVFQANSPNSSPNELGLGSPASAGLVATNGSTAFHHLNGSANSSVAPSPVHLHQLNAVTNNHQSNGLGLSNGLSNSSRDSRENGASKLHNSMMRSLNNSNNNSLAPSLLDYFPAAGNDGLSLSWSHGVNNRARLNHALSSDVSMIQGDVTLAENSRCPIAIMAQPPINMSDLTLEDFLLQIIHSTEGSASKGIKLDFKSTRVVEPAFRNLARHIDYLKGPLVLHADIIAGDNKQGAQPVDQWTFLMLIRTRFPKAIISMGWCVDVNKNTLETGYSMNMVDQMLQIVKEYSLLQPITFPVNAALVKYSIAELQRLLFQVPNSSLTLWCHPGDPVTIEDLMLYRKAFGPSQLYYDLPEEFLNIFKLQVCKR